MRIRNIDHLVLRVVDLDAMLAFYCNVLGCTLERREDEIGLIQLRAGSALIDLVPVEGRLGRVGGSPPTRDGRNMDHFCLRLASFDAERIAAYLNERDVAPGEVASRFGAEGQGPSIYIQDPDGNTVELKGPPYV